MSDSRIAELAQMPLRERALRIAEMFSEGIDDQGPPAPGRLQRRAARKRALKEGPARFLARQARAYCFWLAPSRALGLAKALGLFVRQAFSGDYLSSPTRAERHVEGFCGRAASLAPEYLIEAYARGMVPGAILGLNALWSPESRAVRRPEDFPCDAAPPAAAHRIGVDEGFDQLLALCARANPPRDGKPAFDMALGELYDVGLAHSLEIRDACGRLIAGAIGVAAGAIFTVERLYAEDEAAFAWGVDVLARQLQRWNFVLIDFKAPSRLSGLLGCASMSRDAFCAEAASHACGGRHGRWRLDPDLRRFAPPAPRIVAREKAKAA